MHFKNITKLAFTFARRIKAKQTSEATLAIKKDQDFIPLEKHAFQLNNSKEFKQAQKILSYEGEDKNPHKIVNRMQKGVVWGLGGQLLQLSKKLKKSGIEGSIEGIMQFLELQQTKDIYVHDFGQAQKSKKRYSIVASAYSNRHCFKVGIQLKNGLLEGKLTDQYPPLFVGRKQDEWVLVQFADFNIHIMTENERIDSNLEWRWKNEVSEETIQKYKRMTRSKSRKMFEPIQ